MKRTQPVNINQYIKKATAGLPSRERIDTAAELRVHLNAQVKKHLLEGHSREEAEFLAVDAMGAPAPLNRQLLGHMFTPQLGWRLVVGAVVVIGLWFGVQKLLEPRAGIYKVATTTEDLMKVLQLTTNTFSLIPPTGTKSFRSYMASPEIPSYSVYGQPAQDSNFRHIIQYHDNYQCEKGRTAAISIFEVKYSRLGFGDFSTSATRRPTCVLPEAASRHGISRNVLPQPNAYEIDRWYPIFKVQGQASWEKPPQYTFTYYVIFSSKDASQPISPPKISEENPFHNQSIPAQPESYQGKAKIPIPKGANSVLIIGSAQQARYSGYAVDLTTRNNLKSFDIRLDHNNLSSGNGCLGTPWQIQFGFNPGERNIDLCEDKLQGIPKEFPKDNLVFGEFFSKLTPPPVYKLDTWIPVYVVPNYVSGRIKNPKPQQSTNSWYILQVKFSSKRIEEGVSPFPSDLPKYRLRSAYDYYSLEAVK
jgi:hypothetical protein